LSSERRPLDIDRNPERPLTIGFISPNFRQHPIGHFVISPLENLDRDHFQVVCYSDGQARDGWTSRFQATSATWRDTGALTDAQLAEQIRADRIDILFDLAGHTAQNRLLVFARTPAPIQITWADYVGTTGLATMDFILADQYQVPGEAEPYYAEHVLRMPNGYVCYDPPSYAPAVSLLPALERRFVTFGSFNYRPKITTAVIEVWAKILQRVPDSRLVLKNGGLEEASVAAPLLHEFARRGIEPSRIDCRGWSAHPQLLAEYQHIDLALDPFPYNGGLTTCEATWMGVPVVTFPGETFAGRHSLSHLSNVGFTETIARSLDDYVNLAVGLASDLPRLAMLRSKLRQRMACSPLCDGKLFAHDLMRILRGIWRQRCQQN
jgi:protein O-GlcNAc transferase